MDDSPFEMRFDPKTINHLGLRMYATLPPALAEIVANAYDADASSVVIALHEINGRPDSITVSDDGTGLSKDEINSKFLVIGRNRRETDGDEPSKKYGRMPIGKKGLGKLALFGLAKQITITSRKNGKRNTFILDWDNLNESKDVYRPRAVEVDAVTKDGNGTVVKLTGLKRKSAFNIESVADSLSRMFIVNDTFKLVIDNTKGTRITIDNKRKYRTLNIEFQWDISKNDFVPKGSEYYGRIEGEFYTAQTPIAPASGLRGITLYSRQKLVNAPEFFSASTSSHFFQYLTGWIIVNFIDDLDEDVISTNRQSLDWDHQEMTKLRKYLSGIVSQVNSDWRKKRKEKKKKELAETTGIDTDKWLRTMSGEERESTRRIIDSLGGEESLATYTPVIKALHELVPEYPRLHWRHLHGKIRDRVKKYYENGQYGDAASQGIQIFCEIIRELTGLKTDGTELVSKVFGSLPFKNPPFLQLNDLSDESEMNIQEGQGHLSRGVIIGFRNPISHGPIDKKVPTTFSEPDCLNILSLVSYLVTRLDTVKVNPPTK